MSDDNTGHCDKCNHINQCDWVMCDACGARLPWALPEARKLKLENMTTEQLQTRFAAPLKREPFFLVTIEGRPALAAIVVIIALIWLFLTH